MFKLKKIEKEKLIEETIHFWVIEELNYSSIAILHINDLKLGFRWFGSSSSVEKYQDFLLVGLGKSVCILSTNTGFPKFVCGLNDPFSFFLTMDKTVIVVSETTITVVNLLNFSIQKFIGLPDIIMNVKIEKNMLIISGLDDTFVHEL